MKTDNSRKFIIAGIFIAVILIYLIRIFYVQVLNDSYKLSANNNVLRYETQYPARGMIYDRKGRLMVYNKAVYDLMIIPKQVKDLDTTDFCSLIGISIEEFINKSEKARRFSSVKASVFEKQLSAETYASFQEKLYKFKGFFVQPRTLRKYPDRIAAHVLGYIGEVNDKIVDQNPYYRSGDYIGISGIEKSYEEELRGQRGLKIIMVDVFNRPKGSFQEGKYDTLAVSGNNLISSLDAELQAYAEQLLRNKIGSVVAIEPSSGEILAMVTSPTYDPNLLVGRARTRNYKNLAVDPYKPLFNRAQMAYYPPGSTFKLVGALISEQEGFIAPQTRYACSFNVGSRFIKCHPHPAPADMYQAIQYSCNPYFCTIFRNFVDNKKFPSNAEGYNTWRNHILSFGIGRKINVDMPHELPGFIPTVEYYNKYYGQNRWKGSTIYSLGIGQGEVSITPLQMANTMCIIANRGYYYIPHIIKGIGDGNEIDSIYKVKNYSSVDVRHFEPVIEGMQAVVDGGTARVAKFQNIVVCGKTGTAQNPHGKDHSLFVAFAPRANPKIAIAVMVENSGYGATYAAPIASLMMEKYLTDTITRPALEERMLLSNTLPVINQPLKN